MTEITENAPSFRLENPVSDQHAAFLFGNAAQYQQVMGCLPDMVEEGSGKGKHVVICGAGPSLAEHAAEYCPDADQVWGCNSALVWLAENGHKVTHGFTCDQTAYMLSEWASTPDVEYILASTVHVHLSELLLSRNRKLLWYHNYVGIKHAPVEFDGRSMSWEDWAYTLLWPPCMRAGTGLNAVTRAVDVAEFMGFDKITVLGADHALRVKTPPPRGAPMGSRKYSKWLARAVMHANGDGATASGATPVCFGGTIDGRYWLSKPDMMVSAIFLVRMMRRLGGRLNVVGDTLPGALKDKPDEYLARLPNLVDSAGAPIIF